MNFEFLDFYVIKGEEIDLHLIKTVPGNKAKKWLPAYHFNISLSDSSIPIGKIDIRIGTTKTYIMEVILDIQFMRNIEATAMLQKLYSF